MNIDNDIFSAIKIARLRNQAHEMWEQASKDVQQTYPKSYIESLYNKPKTGNFNSKISILKPVADAVAHALRSTRPKTRYLVDGKGSKLWFIDDYTVSFVWYFRDKNLIKIIINICLNSRMLHNQLNVSPIGNVQCLHVYKTGGCEVFFFFLTEDIYSV